MTAPLLSILSILCALSLRKSDRALAHNHADCSTSDPTRHEILREESLFSLEKRLEQESNRRRRQRRSLQPTDTLCRQCVEIPVVIHIIEDFVGFSESTFYVTDLNIQTQLEVLNGHYQDTPFRFTLQETTRTTNNEWAYGDLYQLDPVDAGAGYPTDLVETITAALRTGGADVANIFFTDGVCNSANFASLPYNRGLFPQGNYSKTDYIFLCPLAIARGIDAANETTLTHEVGHWLSLYHTFAGNSCEANSFGDLVPDTPLQANATFFDPQYACGSTKVRDSCPGQDGNDPLENYMSYGACRTQFTEGQIERMYNQFNRYRRQVDPDCQPWQASVELDILFDSTAPEETILYYIEWGLKYGITIHLSAVDETHIDYAGQRIVQKYCWPISTLYEFRMDDAGLNGMKDGYAKLALNNHEVMSVSGTDNWGTVSAFVVGDTADCGPDRKRLLLEFSFLETAKAEQLSWNLVTADRVWLVASAEETFAYGAESYSSRIMKGHKLFVDKCISGDTDYIFSIQNSFMPLSLGTFRLSMEGQEFQSGDISPLSIYFDVDSSGGVSGVTLSTAAPAVAP